MDNDYNFRDPLRKPTKAQLNPLRHAAPIFLCSRPSFPSPPVPKLNLGTPALTTDYRFFLPFDFLEPDGITLATVLTIELAIFATTPFLELRFFAPLVFFDLVVVALLVFDFGLVVAAFFAISNSGTASPLQIL